MKSNFCHGQKESRNHPPAYFRLTVMLGWFFFWYAFLFLCGHYRKRFLSIYSCWDQCRAKKKVTISILCTKLISALNRFSLTNVFFLLILGRLTMTDERGGCSELRNILIYEHSNNFTLFYSLKRELIKEIHEGIRDSTKHNFWDKHKKWWQEPWWNIKGTNF